jgi:hypothetical protein
MASGERRPPGGSTCRLTDSGPRDHRSGHQAHADQDEGRTPGVDGGLEASADPETDQTTGLAQAICSIVQAGAATAHVEQAGHAQDRHQETDREALGDLSQLAALPEHSQARTHHRHRQDHPGCAHRPTEAAIQDAADHAGLVQIDGQPGQEPTDHQHQSEDLVAASPESGPGHATQKRHLTVGTLVTGTAAIGATP